MNSFAEERSSQRESKGGNMTPQLCMDRDDTPLKWGPWAPGCLAEGNRVRKASVIPERLNKETSASEWLRGAFRGNS